MIEYRIERRSGVPTYQQIVRQTEQALRLGLLKPGDKLPTAREVVEATAVNPNTVLKAYRELERSGLVEPRPGLGTFVLRTLGAGETDGELRDELQRWTARARRAGLDKEDVIALVTSVMEREFADGAADSGTGTRTRKARTS
ncbi:GntR family transcriptional regulator [Streptomyces sp. RY43-2]|uniref:GntR family transcriptional regulator n=1 Tax=Streptomyces macrolidinus TaxID=2952607 RepID=A0ABT0ZHI3_9ACTN|nr:GntR family transcriptional regulator [Streptomyces macrolidinus]MCN9243039.1 GntR family transcriptional regulator [Streptomyces macrolidinus]